MERGGPIGRSAPTAFEGRHRIADHLPQHRIGHVGGGPADRQQRPLGARPAAVGEVRPGLRAPLFAGTLAESTLACDQASAACPPIQSSPVKQHPLALFPHAGHRLVARLPPAGHLPRRPSPRGNPCHGAPVSRMNRLPPTIARSEAHGRPPCGFDAAARKSGAITAHGALVTSEAIIRQLQQIPWFWRTLVA